MERSEIRVRCLDIAANMAIEDSPRGDLIARAAALFAWVMREDDGALTAEPLRMVKKSD